MKTPSDHAQMLLQKAANDLVAARATLATGEALDTVCFHAQQAVEIHAFVSGLVTVKASDLEKDGSLDG
jgi:HEPN domain-containing protein